MQPVMQTTFGFQAGNCHAACVASILEIPLEEVPCWREDTWHLSFEVWLGMRGLALIEFHGDAAKLTHGGGCYIVGGKSPRAGRDGNPENMTHAVVYRNGKLEHDPHPEGGGVLTHDTVSVIVPALTPSERARNLYETYNLCVCGATGLRVPGCPQHDRWKSIDTPSVPGKQRV